MSSIKIVTDDFNDNVSTAKSAVGDLASTKLTATDIRGTDLKPFTEIVSLAKQISSAVGKYQKLANNDTEQFTKVSKDFTKADIQAGKNFSK
ncbi:hypothetical protein [Bombilactobacillus thymidiniphilus]|uniref:Type VII secretion effector (TIGR04197 family) n=1 Tax=Bombilactobacillus thymidiniphilus TaxID=2923363 RepID=A0ABY4PBJ9_9LACO|nr:hypothetical protein [Bombilactobacillus thymidiniphilus]UQS82990.1 hypothetical protein MOO47_04200 [Bombilactobacillus thymidiniphilus]